MKLYLVQHGEALTKDMDPGRPLSPQGEKDVQKTATFLREAGVSVDRILHSGKMRARQSAEILAGGLLTTTGNIETAEGINPTDSVKDFSAEINGFEQDTMVVGHLPFMTHMVSYLVSGEADGKFVDYRPGSVVCLEKGEENRWIILWMLRPELLDA